jgi:ATP-dependent Clp protease adaptor protein ClpS
LAARSAHDPSRRLIGTFPIAGKTDIMKGGSEPGFEGHTPTMGKRDKDITDNPSTDVIVKSKPKTKTPSMYKVLMLNDDYTPMEFVVHVLEKFFGKNRPEATRIMLHVHQRGVGVCGVFTYEVAETKVNSVVDYARRHQHPLQCTLEKE